jgi:hypothetical protein
VCFIVAGIIRGVELPNKDSIVKKHLEFARGHLNDDDELLRSESLSVVATYDPVAFGDIIRKGLSDSSDLVQDAALTHLRDSATDRDLAVVQTLWKKLTSRPANPMEGTGVAVEPIFTEMSCLELLYQRGGADWKKKVGELLEKDLKSKANHARWEIVVQTVGQLKLRSAASILRQEANTADERLYAASSLTRMGDEQAAAYLRSKIVDVRSQGFIVRDLELIKLLKLSEQDLVPLLEGATLERRIEIARALASRGRAKELDELWRKVIDTPDMRDVVNKLALNIKLIGAIGDVGDESYLERLDKVFNDISTDSGKLMASDALIRIVRRANTAK